MEACQIENILYAGIVGDALGVPVEFKKRDSYYLDDMTDSGTWEQPKGSWSDDTSFSLPLMENLTEGGNYDQLMKKFDNYMFHNQYTPDDQTFGIGNTCTKAIRNWSVNHYSALKSGDTSVYANGNGALMRLAPLAIHLMDEPDLQKRLKLTKNYTSLTHRHPRAIVGSYIYLEILHALLNGQPFRRVLETLPDKLTKALQNQPDELAELPNYEAMFKSDFDTTLRQNIKSTGYVVDTLLTCTWCVLNSTSIDSAVILAVNLGDDTDTVASITATLASCEMLSDHISDEWKKQLRNQDLLKSIIEPFAKSEAKQDKSLIA
ncbi:ADP-ribosylglycohydrolase family protein [Companilactobacillus halodurans]|uniref:ADP-ribosylglycohydrolase n=1 Tax=Companilactobacillus halodurans TaxID=2584183 RepID=A0A5P1A0Y1_9LACO|nr:ADP-ribosylglycohydrolase family protein [Companilactobacillus halodurans]MQS76183.1 ADP-ribosylglycohydrolase [Companilactobacillus halodurans]MQS98484.1 ADP-ribosylglycohydrolase [Companilactobacillus halodurans]